MLDVAAEDGFNFNEAGMGELGHAIILRRIITQRNVIKCRSLFLLFLWLLISPICPVTRHSSGHLCSFFGSHEFSASAFGTLRSSLSLQFLQSRNDRFQLALSRLELSPR